MDRQNGDRRLIYGTGSASSAARVLKSYGKEHPLVVSTPYFSSTGFYTKLISELGQDWERFSEISTGPSLPEVEHLAEAYRNKECDSIISVGNSAVISASKLLRYYFAHDAAHLSIPCTLTVSSFSDWAEYRLGDEINFVRDQMIVPEMVILDPAASVETEGNIWYSSGLGVMDYALSNLANDGIGKESTDLLLSSLANMVIDLPGQSVESRMELFLSTWYSRVNGYDVEKDPLTSIRKGLSEELDIPAEMVSVLTFPVAASECYRKNPGALADLSSRLGFRQGKNSDLASGTLDLLYALPGKLGLVSRIREYGIGRNDVSEALQQLSLDRETVDLILSSVSGLS